VPLTSGLRAQPLRRTPLSFASPRTKGIMAASLSQSHLGGVCVRLSIRAGMKWAHGARHSRKARRGPSRRRGRGGGRVGRAERPTPTLLNTLPSPHACVMTRRQIPFRDMTDLVADMGRVGLRARMARRQLLRALRSHTPASSGPATIGSSHARSALA